ncbi:hypothetical protein ACTFIW_002744 [Dictyostelium discoideum]
MKVQEQRSSGIVCKPLLPLPTPTSNTNTPNRTTTLSNSKNNNNNNSNRLQKSFVDNHQTWYYSTTSCCSSTTSCCSLPLPIVVLPIPIVVSPPPIVALLPHPPPVKTAPTSPSTTTTATTPNIASITAPSAPNLFLCSSNVAHGAASNVAHSAASNASHNEKTYTIVLIMVVHLVFAMIVLKSKRKNSRVYGSISKKLRRDPRHEDQTLFPQQTHQIKKVIDQFIN